MNALRSHPTLCGLVGGPLILTALRWLTYRVGMLIAPNLTSGLSNGLLYSAPLDLFLASLFMGAALGGLSVHLAVHWWERDAARLEGTLGYARWVALLYGAWTGMQALVMLKALSSTTTTVFQLPNSNPFSWQGAWLLFSLVTNLPLLWTFGLVGAGFWGQRQLRAESQELRTAKALLTEV